MLEMTYLRDDFENDTAVISFEGDRLDIYELRDYAKMVNLVKGEVEEEYYRGFGKSNSDCENNYGKADYETVVNPVVKIDVDEILNSMKVDVMKASDMYDDTDKDVCDIIEEEDIVNHPHHYAENGAMECIDEMILLYGEEAVMNFCLCNMHKYRYRANMKGGAVDKQKSDWYVTKYKELKDIVQSKKIAKHDKFVMDMRRLLEDGAALHLDEPEFTRLYKELFPLD